MTAILDALAGLARAVARAVAAAVSDFDTHVAQALDLTYERCGNGPFCSEPAAMWLYVTEGEGDDHAAELAHLCQPCADAAFTSGDLTDLVALDRPL